MFRVLARWTALVCAGVFALPAWACFPGTDLTPKHEISTLDLPQQVAGDRVVLESEGHLLQTPASALLAELLQSGESIESPDDLANALRSKMRPGRNIDARELAALLIATPPANPADDPMRERRITARTLQRLQFAFAKLLQEGKVLVTETSSQRVLLQIELDRFSEVCHGGRLFTGPEDKVILRVADWIS